MSLNKILIATLAGTVTLVLVGFLVWGMLLAKFMADNSTAGLMKPDSEMIWWAMIAGNLAGAFLVAYIFGKWANISTFLTGAQAGALIFGLMVAFFNLVWFASANFLTLNGVLVDIISSALVGAVAGGVIGLVLGRGKS